MNVNFVIRIMSQFP